MAEARSRDEWGRTSALLWIVAESKRNKKKRARAFRPDEFNPWEQTGDAAKRSRLPGKRLSVGLLLSLRGMFERMGAEAK